MAPPRPPIPPTLQLPAPVLSAMLTHARGCAPNECVGLLFGRRGQVTRRVPLVNTASAPRTQFFADPLGLLRALREADRYGDALVALYHSHPYGPSTPSETDLLNAHYVVPTLIVTLHPEGVRAFGMDADGFWELGLEVVH